MKQRTMKLWRAKQLMATTEQLQKMKLRKMKLRKMKLQKMKLQKMKVWTTKQLMTA